MKLYYAGFNLYGQITKSGECTVRSFIDFDYNRLENIEFGHFFTVLQMGDTFLHGAFDGNTNQILNMKVPPDIVQVNITDKHIILLARNGKLFKINTENVHQIQELSHFVNVEQENVSDQIVKVACGVNISAALSKSGKIFNIPTLLNFKNDNVANICAGREHCLILDALGNVYSFGRGSRGQLGHGCLENETDPKQIEALAGIAVKKIAVGGWHSCALSKEGDVYTWGWNGNGQLGLMGEESKISVMGSPQVVDVGDNMDLNVVNIACGNRHTVLLSDDKKLFGMGWNKYFQLGSAVVGENIYAPALLHTFEDSEVFNLKCGPWSTAVY